MAAWRERVGDPLAGRVAAASLGAAVILMVTALAVPWLTDVNPWVLSLPPLHADWDPRVGPGTVPSLVVGATGLIYARRAAEYWSWGRLLMGAFGLSVAWMVSLATVDGWGGLGDILNTSYEYLGTARATNDVSATLHEYVSRITFAATDHWPVHIAGHPPGALLFFVVLVRVGLGSGLAAGLVVTLLAATTPVAVLITLRTLGAESAARRAAPFLVLGPAAVWSAVSGDAMFGAVAAWGLCCLAMAATRTGLREVVGWGLLAGLLLGYTVLLSYGLVLLAFPAVAVLLAARSARPLPYAVLSALAVVVAFWVAGFAWWDGFAALRIRYYEGVGGHRPYSYWVWANLAALCFSAGPLVASSVAEAVRRTAGLARQAVEVRPVLWLTGAAALCIIAADASGMSKAEVERIWLPFVPWLLLGCGLLSPRWRTRGLVVQVVVAVAVQHLLNTGW